MDTTSHDSEQPLIVCHECDLLQRQPVIGHHGRVLCSRCQAILLRSIPNSIERTIALALAGLILFIVANLFPFMSFEIGSQVTKTTLTTGIRELFRQDLWSLAALVLFTSVIAPLLQLSLMLYIFVPLGLGKAAASTRPAFRLLQRLRSWNMIEVFMIGILVALVKLTQMATIVPGIAMWSFMALIFILTAATASIDGRVIWQRLE